MGLASVWAFSEKANMDWFRWPLLVIVTALAVRISAQRGDSPSRYVNDIQTRLIPWLECIELN